MIGLIQRVGYARVLVEGACIAEIRRGILLLLGVEKNDQTVQADKLVHRVLNYRIFEDAAGKMNCSVQDIGGALLVVPQFTLAADTQSGMRPGFSTAAPPVQGKALFDHFLSAAAKVYPAVSAGEFGANMEVVLSNIGPATFILKA